MAVAQELRLLAKTARLYYERGLSQAEIAAQLDLSQATVSRLLKRALEQQIVKISVTLPPVFHAQLEDDLQKKYGLKEAIVVDVAANDDDEQIQRALGAATAFYLQSTLKQREVIGLSSWSATLLATVDAMRPLSHPIDATVVQILGGVGNPGAALHANPLTERFARLVQGRAVFLPAPGVVGSAETRQVLLEDMFVSEAMALFDQVTLALVGIGDLQPSKLLVSSGNRFSSAELDMLHSKGAVGDICLHFFDKDGSPVDTPLNDRVISMNLEQLRRVRRTVGVAGGLRKTQAIRGALVGKWINVLIADRLVAEALVANVNTP
jgi:DNA-binding transcriptional regulator LsrR (DeoR family)